MIQRLRARWKQWRSSLWLVPAGMVLGAFVGALGMIQLSAFVPREMLIRFPRLFGADAQSSRSMLSTIAGSMATIAGVTFSITVVAVAQASTQYTSRILRNFLSDRPSQVVLGMLAGTFVYCLVLIRTIRGDADLLFIPGLGVLGAFVLAILSIGFLVYFIHHIAESLQASHVLARVRRETIAVIDRLYPDALAESMPHSATTRDTAGLHWRWTNAQASGYLQQVDGDALAAWASQRNAVVRLDYRIGDYIVDGTPLLATASRDPDVTDHIPSGDSPDAERPLLEACTIGAYRTIDDDASFGIQQVVDIANKALSPGINDATTAVAAIDTLCAILVRLGSRCTTLPARIVDGVERVIQAGHSYEEFVSIGLDQLRRNASADVGVSVHLMRVIARIIAATPCETRRTLLLASADLLRDASSRRAEVAADGLAIDAAHAQARLTAVTAVTAEPGHAVPEPSTW
ncbi:MAG: DUF2254 domain-containing protein [Gemmatimonadaceae bacterium]